MKNGLRRVAVASMLTVAVTAAGVVPGAVASEPASARDAAVTVRQLHDELAEAVAANDLPAMRWTLAELTPVVTDLERGERYAVDDGSREAVASTSAEASTVMERIETLLPQRADPPSLPELLNMLLQQLLKILAELISNLLTGGLPLP